MPAHANRASRAVVWLRTFAPLPAVLCALFPKASVLRASAIKGTTHELVPRDQAGFPQAMANQCKAAAIDSL